jgi:hypothetical protein
MPRQRDIPRGGTRGSVFKQVARIRREDPVVLLQEQRYSGAIYLGGYAVECILKWAVTQRQALIYLPQNLETHDWDTLLAATGLQRLLQAEPVMNTLYSDLADIWGPELRYQARE